MQYLSWILLHSLFHVLFVLLILSFEVFIQSVVQLALLDSCKIFAPEVEEQL